MKILGKDGKEYASVSECLEADERFETAEKEKKNKEAEEKALVSKKKKEKADIIKRAEEDLNIAQAEYEKARGEAEKLIEKAREEAREIIRKAEDNYREASNKRYQAVEDFNKEFGTYTVTYTGKEALDEYNKLSRNLNNFWNNLFSWWD